MIQTPIYIDSSDHGPFKENDNDNFKILLPQDFRYSHGDWRCAVSSITFRNGFKIMQDLEMKFNVYHYDDEDLTRIEEFEIPSILRSHDEIIDYFKDKIINVATCTKTVSNQIKIVFKEKIVLKIDKHLAVILGCNNFTNNYQMIARIKGGVYISPLKIQNINLFPAQLYVTCSFVEHSVVAGSMSPLLKIVPLSDQTDNQYLTIDFGHSLEFVPVRLTDLKVLEFKIKSHTDKSPGFIDKKSSLYMSLIFQKF